MNNLVKTLGETVLGGSLSSIIAVSANLDSLFTVLLAFGVTLVTTVGSKLVEYLVALLNKKTKDLDDKDEDKKENK